MRYIPGMPRGWQPGDPIKDRFGNNVTVGDFISYILYHQGGGGMGGIFYGHVTKIGKTGKVEARSIKLTPSCKVIENTIKDNNGIIKMPASVEKAWIDYVMVSKLSAA